MGFSKKDSELSAQAVNFSTVLAADPVVYGETAAVATAVTAAVDAYVDSLNILTEARANGVRSAQMTATKDSDRLSMLNVLRPIYSSVQRSTTISDAAKIALGVHIVDVHPTPQPVPGFAPQMTVEKVDGWVVTLRLRDAEEPNRKGRPPYTSGAALFSYVGAEPPAEASAYKFEGNTGKTTIDIQVPQTVAMGSTVYFVAFWFNDRKESGPACSPVSATIGAGSTIPMMKIAA